MEQEQILNEHSLAEGDSSTNPVSQGSVTVHNKQKFPLMHTAATGTRSITRTAIALFGLFVFVCCRNSGSDTIPTSDTIFGDSVTSGVLENNNADTLLTEVPPPPEWKCKSNGDNVYRVLTDSEIANLSFVAYHKKNWVKSLDETFDRWEEFASVHRPYYSKTTCPSVLLGSIKWPWGIFLCLYSLPGSSRFRMYHLELIQPYELLYFIYIHRHQSCRFGTLGTARTQ